MSRYCRKNDMFQHADTHDSVRSSDASTSKSLHVGRSVRDNTISRSPSPASVALSPAAPTAHSSTPLFLPDSRGPSPFAFNASAWNSICDRASRNEPVVKRARLEAPEDADCRQKPLDTYIRHFFDMAADDWESYDEELGDTVSYGCALSYCASSPL